MAIPDVDWSHAFDVVALGDICDALIMMGYDYHWRNAPTSGPVAPLRGESLNVTRSVRTYLDSGLVASKLLLGVPWFGYEWLTDGAERGAPVLGPGRSVLYADAQFAAAANGRMFDTTTATPWYRYRIDSAWYQTWYEDSLSLALKYRLVNDDALGGIGIWALGYQADAIDVWQGIHQAFDRPSRIATDDRDDTGLAISVRGGRIVLRVERARRLDVDLFDALGRRVATLASGEVDAGVHELRLDETLLARGVYLLRAADVSCAVVVR